MKTKYSCIIDSEAELRATPEDAREWAREHGEPDHTVYRYTCDLGVAYYDGIEEEHFEFRRAER